MRIAGGVRENAKKSAKNAIFRYDLDLGPVTLGLKWYVDLA